MSIYSSIPNLLFTEPEGYYFRSEGNPNKFGMVRYDYEESEQETYSENEIVFGVMTDEKDKLLLRLESAVLEDFIEFWLVSGN